MFGWFKKKRIIKYIGDATEYLKQMYEPIAPFATPEEKDKKKDNGIRYSLKSDNDNKKDVPENNVVYSSKNSSEDNNIRYSLKGDGTHNIRYSDKDMGEKPILVKDKYDFGVIASLMQKYNLSAKPLGLLKDLDKTLNETFVDALIIHINNKGLKDSEVYKAAQIDRRLFSKIMSDREYKPAKDTAIAISVALKLTLEETNDLLSRAGYTLSHSNKKDVIIEYFFREGIYKLDDINEVLFNLEQKIIGR